MSQKITPFLWFNNNADDAIHFYTSVFKNSKIVSIKKFGEGAPGMSSNAISGTFEIEGQTFYALDGGPMFKFTPAISLFVSCDTQEEIDYLWEKLSENGRKDRCGWLQDQFGLSWQIVPPQLGKLLGDSDGKKSKRVLEAMLKMDKLIIADLQKAYDQE
jgi:predicted 3-demethylubiquinone-9 3-methyltransferase (glyoxalase superfamily)